MSPSGNIGCVMIPDDQYAPYVRCDIAERSFASPPRPSDCQLDYGSSLSLGTRAQLGCTGDTVLFEAVVGTDLTLWYKGPGITRTSDPTRLAALAYGEAITMGEFECSSAEQGVTCENTRASAGFFLSRESYRLFP